MYPVFGKTLPGWKRFTTQVREGLVWLALMCRIQGVSGLAQRWKVLDKIICEVIKGNEHIEELSVGFPNETHYKSKGGMVGS